MSLQNFRINGINKSENDIKDSHSDSVTLNFGLDYSEYCSKVIRENGFEVLKKIEDEGDVNAKY